MARTYVHSALWNEYKSGKLTREEYLQKKTAKKPRKKYDTSNRIGKKRGKYTGWKRFQKLLKEEGVRPGAKVPKTKAEYDVLFQEQLDTPLASGVKVTREEALHYLVQERTYTAQQLTSLTNNVNDQFQFMLKILKQKLPNEDMTQWTREELEIALSFLTDYQYEYNLAVVVFKNTTTTAEFLNWQLTSSDIRGETKVWKMITQIVEYEDLWSEVYGS